jgi:hypothetical protein
MMEEIWDILMIGMTLMEIMMVQLKILVSRFQKMKETYLYR